MAANICTNIQKKYYKNVFSCKTRNKPAKTQESNKEHLY